MVKRAGFRLQCFSATRVRIPSSASVFMASRSILHVRASRVTVVPVDCLRRTASGRFQKSVRVEGQNSVISFYTSFLAVVRNYLNLRSEYIKKEAFGHTETSLLLVDNKRSTALNSGFMARNELFEEVTGVMVAIFL